MAKRIPTYVTTSISNNPPVLRFLLKALHEISKEDEEFTGWPLASNEVGIYYKNEKGDVVALITYYIVDNYIMFIHTLYVEPEYRRKKYAFKLLKEIENYCKGNNIKRIEFGIYPSNKGSLGLITSFKKYDVKPMATYFRVKL